MRGDGVRSVGAGARRVTVEDAVGSDAERVDERGAVEAQRSYTGLHGNDGIPWSPGATEVAWRLPAPVGGNGPAFPYGVGCFRACVGFNRNERRRVNRRQQELQWEGRLQPGDKPLGVYEELLDEPAE